MYGGLVVGSDTDASCQSPTSYAHVYSIGNNPKDTEVGGWGTLELLGTNLSGTPPHTERSTPGQSLRVITAPQ